MTTRKKKHNDDFFSHAKETMGEERYIKSLEKGMQTVNELRLKMAREELGLTQQNMEGLTQSEVSKIEKRKDVKVSTLDKYAHAMKMKVQIMLVPEDDKKSESILIYG